MRALIYDGQLHLETNALIPQRTAGESLLKMRRAGICNTDLELVAGMYNFTGSLGHEFVAEVIEGPLPLVGRRVVGEINIPCGECDFCQRGIPSQCRRRRAIGIHNYPGAFADYLSLPAANLHRVPDAISDDEAVFVEPLAAALEITEAVHISPRHRVIVLGLGKLGLLVAQVLRLTGAEVIGVARHDKQATLLHQWGIHASTYEDLQPEQAQVVVDCTGQAQGFQDALNLVEARGTIVLKSTFHGQPAINLSTVAVREIRVVGSRCGPFEAALRLLEMGLVDVRSLIEARYPFEAALDAMQRAAQKSALKVLLDF